MHAWFSVFCVVDFVMVQKWIASEEQVKQLKRAATERRVCLGGVRGRKYKVGGRSR